MLNIKILKIFLILVILFLAIYNIQWAQSFDYHKEESPSISWNGISIFDARLLGSAGISLMASPGLAVISNPALIPFDPSIKVSGSWNVSRYEAFQYWGMNQGPLIDIHNQSETKSNVSSLCITIPIKSIIFATGWYTPNTLELPSYNYNETYYSYKGEFSGIQHSFFAATAFHLLKNVQIGLKLEYLLGTRNVYLDEIYSGYPFTFTQSEKHRMHTLIPTIGAAIQLLPSWKIAASLVYPLRGQSNCTLNRVFISPQTRIEIKDLKSNDSLYTPARISIGTTAGFLPAPFNPGEYRLTVGAELMYVAWSTYKYEFYSQFLPRQMRNTLIFALAMQWGIYNGNKNYFLRLGYRRDPQPVKNPSVTLNGISAGIGTQIGKYSADIGGFYTNGQYTGIKQSHWVFNTTMQISLGSKQ